MKHGLKLASMIAAIALHFPAHADDMLDGLKKMNAEGCVATIDILKDAPKDPKLAKPYCTCLYDTYFDSLTAEEKNNLTTGKKASPATQKNLQLHLQTAKAECRKKVGS